MTTSADPSAGGWTWGLREREPLELMPGIRQVGDPSSGKHQPVTHHSFARFVTYKVSGTKLLPA